MRSRLHQFVLLASILWTSWLTMMLVHESGHVLGAVTSGGRVRQVVWHPMVISRTDVRPNPHPLVEVWAGPVVGSVVPLAVAAVLAATRVRFAYLAWVLAGFCLIANGAYIGIGVWQPVGDTRELVALGTPRWCLALFGAVAVVGGFWIWQRVSPRLGFGRTPATVSARQAYATLLVAVIVTLIGFAFGNRGA
jgi:hypothetical protein